eukprot:293525_1
MAVGCILFLLVLLSNNLVNAQFETCSQLRNCAACLEEGMDCGWDNTNCVAKMGDVCCGERGTEGFTFTAVQWCPSRFALTMVLYLGIGLVALVIIIVIRNSCKRTHNPQGTQPRNSPQPQPRYPAVEAQPIFVQAQPQQLYPAPQQALYGNQSQAPQQIVYVIQQQQQQPPAGHYNAGNVHIGEAHHTNQ